MNVAAPRHLRLAGWLGRTRALGPGRRAVVWVQGCPFRCPGCLSPHTHDFGGGTTVSIASLVRDLTAIDDVEGLTISGGEPFSQAAELATLVEKLRRRTRWSFMCYTGHRLADLERREDPATRRLLANLDVLVDGLYVEALHTAKRWRGSSNQQVHFLTPRYADLRTAFEEECLSVETHVDDEGHLRFVGIPPRGFVPQILGAFAARGVTLREIRG